MMYYSAVRWSRRGLWGLLVPAIAAFVVCAGAATSSARARVRAEVIVVSPVYTMDATLPRAEAVAVGGGRVVAVGSRADIMKFRAAGTRVIETGPGQIALPGLIDAHGHVHSLGRSLSEVQMLGTSSKEECAALVREKAETTPADRWVCGRGWDQNDWAVGVFPTWSDLSATESHPVYLRRVDGHAAWVNRTALDLCGITRDTADPPGGRIIRDGSGEPTGVLIDNATNLVSDRIPVASADELDDRMRAAVVHCSRFGLVAVHDAGTTREELESLERLASRGELPLRVYCMIDGDVYSLVAEYFREGPTVLAGGRIVVRAVKLYADGALGSRGAALLKPYDDEPGNVGLLLTEPLVLEAVARRAIDAGYQVCTHAIGDRGNRVALDAYDAALHAAGAAQRDHRFRIEHCQVISDADFPRFHALGVTPSMQPTHATSDMYWAQTRIGPERITGAYAWRRFLDGGDVLALGSDFPVESANPLLGIYAAVSRQDDKGWPEGGWYPLQKLTVEEAVRGFTWGAAYAEFAEAERGTITVGKRADIVVLDRDIFTIPAHDILATSAVYTISDGAVVFARDEGRN